MNWASVNFSEQKNESLIEINPEVAESSCFAACLAFSFRGQPNSIEISNSYGQPTFGLF